MRRDRRRLAWLVAAVALVACGEADPRRRLLAIDAADPVEQALRQPARMKVVYWPAIGACLPGEVAILEELQGFADGHDDVEVISVLPRDWKKAERYGVALPGHSVHLSTADYERQRQLSPLPRIEVWDHRGSLLMMRSLAGLGSQAQLLRAELAASRALTAPLAGPRDRTAEIDERRDESSRAPL